MYGLVSLTLFAGALIGASITLSMVKMLDYRRRLTAIEQRLADADRNNRHDQLGRARRDIGEATLFDLARLRDETRLLTEWVEYASRRAAHVAAGGSPDDPPTQWKE